ncbi:streptomycin 6-kinase [Phycicoccus badiiscoriae]|uniref:Streptomycin 6-kinase n=1 Tax=Pedococcus badiiscoriae TaxID=642776 RepID=A0A852WMF7_9MICO|nr:aminoglycoside phosphotransferase family protein [Pedococcus badiiscoriae]NYG06462.1 streptomycin 6-kinase [Pedococcus badiiscoriae]
MTWTVPAPFVANRADDTQREWARSLGSVAARLAQEWSLEPAGDPMWGYVSVVWPVRGPAGQSWVLKLGEDDPRMRAEGLVLRAWQGRGVVGLVRHDAETRALLLEALDAGRDLEGEADIDAATQVIGGFIAGFAKVPAPQGVPSLSEELRRIRAHVHRRRDFAVEGLTRRDVDGALDTLSAVAAQIDAHGPWPAIHGDLHYCNVLHTRAGDPDPGWRAIDPLPSAGPAELDVIAAMRNRWQDALATGDPERALRRRLDQLVEVAGLDLALARALCQAVAVDNVSWILLETPLHQDRFLDPYRVMATWH